MKPRRSFGTSHITRKSARAILSHLLWGCTLERLQGFTAESLAGSYNVPLSQVEEMLAGARKGRGA